MHSLTIEEAADFLKCHPQTVMEQARMGKIPGKKIGRRWVFIKEHLADFISYHQSAESKSVVIKPELKTWQSTKEASITGWTSSAQTASEYEKLLARKTNVKRKSCTTN